jgi:hypothetical protein
MECTNPDENDDAFDLEGEHEDSQRSPAMKKPLRV